MNNTNVINWYDIKDIEVINETSVTDKKQWKPVVMKRKFNNNDGTIPINHAICKKVTAAHLEPFECKLVHNCNNKVKYHCDGGWFNGKTVCIKCRADKYNSDGNFTFTDDDLLTDIIAIYFHDVEKNIGYWYICDTEKLDRSKMRKCQNIYICNQKHIIDIAWANHTVSFEK